MEAQSIFCVSHFKGHGMFGFGGALKNMGMGAATPPGKRILHAGMAGRVNHKLCTACQTCLKNCPAEAIYLEGETVRINQQKCIGCGECVTVCPKGAVEVAEKEIKICEEKTAVYAYALAKNKNCLYVNYLMNINRLCDCAGKTEPILIPDVGILVSNDAVAIDQASIDWVNEKAGKDLFLEVEGNEYEPIFKIAAEIGLGTREYEIINL